MRAATDCDESAPAFPSAPALRFSVHRAGAEKGISKMQTLDAIKDCRAVREYTDAPVTRATIDRLITAGALAPSAMNLQPWAFAAISGAERVTNLGSRAKEWLLSNFDQTSLEPSLRKLIEPAEYRLFHGAPAIVLVLAKSTAEQAAEDCCLAAHNLMLAARDEGLGTC